MDKHNMVLPRITYSGVDALENLRRVVAGCKKAAIFTDKGILGAGLVDLPQEIVRSAGVETVILSDIPAEPSYGAVQTLVDEFRTLGADIIIAVGGGSAMDTAKLASILVTDEYTVKDLLDDPLRGKKTVTTCFIPTTAGTGSEATPNAILAIPEQQTKAGIISPVLLPDYVALLPELTTSMPPSIAASTGIDALCHLLECFTSTVANPVSDNAALIGLHKLVRHIERSVNQPQDLTAKLEMLWASWYGGAAINYAGTHLVHALSYPLGGTWHLPHGVANAILLAPCMRVVRPHAVAKFAQVWDLIPDADRTLSAEEKSHALVAWLAALVKRLPLPDNLAALGVPQESISALSAAAQNVKRLMNNAPCSVSREEIAAIYQTLYPEHA